MEESWDVNSKIILRCESTFLSRFSVFRTATRRDNYTLSRAFKAAKLCSLCMPVNLPEHSGTCSEANLKGIVE